jgi:tetratricopeptide (TPR) repeat protein
VSVLIGLGEAQRLLGRFLEAEQHSQRAVQLAGRIQPSDTTLLAAALNGLGIVFKDTGRFSDAAAAYERALQLREEALGRDDPRTASLLHNLAGLAHAEGRPVEGEAHIRRALQLRGQAEGPASTGTASELAVLGALLLEQHRITEAELILRQSLAIWQNRFGADHYEVAIVQHNLAALYAERGDNERSALAYRQVLKHQTPCPWYESSGRRRPRKSPRAAARSASLNHSNSRPTRRSIQFASWRRWHGVSGNYPPSRDACLARIHSQGDPVVQFSTAPLLIGSYCRGPSDQRI